MFFHWIEWEMDGLLQTLWKTDERTFRLSLHDTYPFLLPLRKISLKWLLAQSAFMENSRRPPNLFIWSVFWFIITFKNWKFIPRISQNPDSWSARKPLCYNYLLPFVFDALLILESLGRVWKWGLTLSYILSVSLRCCFDWSPLFHLSPLIIIHNIESSCCDYLVSSVWEMGFPILDLCD